MERLKQMISQIRGKTDEDRYPWTKHAKSDDMPKEVNTGAMMGPGGHRYKPYEKLDIPTIQRIEKTLHNLEGVRVGEGQFSRYVDDQPFDQYFPGDTVAGDSRDIMYYVNRNNGLTRLIFSWFFTGPYPQSFDKARHLQHITPPVLRATINNYYVGAREPYRSARLSRDMPNPDAGFNHVETSQVWRAEVPISKWLWDRDDPGRKWPSITGLIKQALEKLDQVTQDRQVEISTAHAEPDVEL